MGDVFIYNNTFSGARSIAAAMRNNLNDINGYLKGNMDSMLRVWELQLRRLKIPEKYHQGFLDDIGSIKQEKRYNSPEHLIKCFQIRGCNDYS